MSKGYRKRGPRLLVTHRDIGVFLQRARVNVSEGRVIYQTADDDLNRSWNLPHANVAILYLGQGTSITQEAVQKLSEENVFVAFTGTGGTPLHMGALTTYRPTRHLLSFFPVWNSDPGSMAAARSLADDRISAARRFGIPDLGNDKGLIVAASRFEESLEKSGSPDVLMGHEGRFASSMFRVAAACAGIDSFVRSPGKGDPGTPSGDLNALVDHGNYLAYGIAGCALHALGIPAGMSVLHGMTRAGGLVFDLADSFKDSYVLPSAVEAMRSGKDEAGFRSDLIRKFNERKTLEGAILSAEKMIRLGRVGMGLGESL